MTQDKTKIKLNDALKAHEDSLFIDLHSNDRTTRYNARLKLDEMYYSLYLAGILTYWQMAAKRELVKLEYDISSNNNGGGKEYKTFAELLA